jgi:integrase
VGVYLQTGRQKPGNGPWKRQDGFPGPCARSGGGRASVAQGLDPIAARQEAIRGGTASLSFKECAVRYIGTNKAGWRNAKHAGQWEATLEKYAYPVIGSLPVGAVGVGEVSKILEPIWSLKTETASRVRGRIETVLDWAKARGYRDGENPARWRGHMDKLLPPRTKVRRVRHHPAMPYDAVAAFMADLRQQEGIAMLALEFTILTAARTTETTGATLGEFDLAAKVWMVPGDRMKAGKEHRVPLSPRAVEIVKDVLQLHGADPKAAAPLFLGNRKDRHLSNGAMLALLDRMGRQHHGARVPFDVPGLGGGMHELSESSRRNGAGSRRRE